MPWKSWYEDARVRIVSDGELLVAIWWNAPLPEQMRALDAAQVGHHGELGEGRQIFVNLVLDGIPSFSDEVRRKAAELSRRAEEWRSVTAHVILIPGLRGVAVRSFVSTFMLMARARERTGVFGSIADGARFIGQKHGTPRWSEARALAALTDAAAQRPGPGPGAAD